MQSWSPAWRLDRLERLLGKFCNLLRAGAGFLVDPEIGEGRRIVQDRCALGTGLAGYRSLVLRSLAQDFA